MNQFQIIASVVMLIIIVMVMAARMSDNKQRKNSSLTAEERASLDPTTQETNFNQSLPFDIVEAIHAGNMIQAIKLYRAQFGTSLKESKEAIDRAVKALKK